MEFRIATATDFDSVKRLWAYAFNGDEPFASWYFSRFYNPDNALGCWRDGQLLAVLHMHPYQLYLRGSVIDASYIVGVATDPVARRSGLTGPLLAEALAEMRRRGRPVSILMPFKAGFYYPYDWRLCYHHLKYNLQLEDLRPVAKPAGDLRPAGLADIAAFEAVYQRFVTGRHGYVVRAAGDWRHLLGEHENDGGYCYLAEFDGLPAGYILYLLRDGKITVREMAYANTTAQQALLDFIYNHRSHAQSVEWDAPFDPADKVLFTLFEAKQDIRVFPFMTARLADIEQALRQIHYPDGLWEVDLALSDELAAWNNRAISLQVREGRAQVTALQRQAAATMTVGAFTQLVFGRLTAEELCNQGELAGSDAAVGVLARLFPRCDNYINEYF
ncbi:MAG: GNAT family N-acetyltransferase [Sporomusaceae bacterium]|nr:GNAT family N-acetyltransferase [Sporomusaceae bacterium]